MKKIKARIIVNHTSKKKALMEWKGFSADDVSNFHLQSINR